MHRQKTTTIAIDGPAGSGKSTIGQLLAQALGFAMDRTRTASPLRVPCDAIVVTNDGRTPAETVTLILGELAARRTIPS